jgi:choline transporter-like protein 2/4/5
MGCCSKNETDAVELKQTGEDGEAVGPYGAKKKFDPTFNGPIKNRSCTDIICCLLFIVALCAMLITGVLAFSWGNPKRLLYPTDSHGNSCGSGDYVDKKYLFFFDLLECIPTDITAMFKITSCPTQQICVKMPE